MESKTTLFSEGLNNFKNKLTQNWFINNIQTNFMKQKEISIYAKDNKP